MNLDAIVEAVGEEVRRPNKQSAIIRAVRATIISAHSFECFAQDLVEDVVELSATSNTMKVPLPPRFRYLQSAAPLTKYGVIMNISTNTNHYEIVSPQDIVTEAGNDLYDIVYIAGNSMVLRSTVVPEKLGVSYYQVPDVSLGTLETWLMASYPETIINGALSRFYRSERQQEVAREFEAMYLQDLQGITNMGIAANG